MRLELHAKPEEVMRAVEALQELARAAGYEENAVFGLALALEECGANVVNHALQRDPAKTFHVSIEREGEVFVVEIRDRGPNFDPTAAVARAEAADDDLPGGWGIQLVRRSVDEVRYERVGDENVLRLSKRLASAAGGP